FTLILISINIMLDRLFIQPLNELAAVTDSYSRGDMDTREFDDDRNDEIGRLQRAINRLRRSLEKAMEIAQGGLGQ
ncbi:MAG: HAMP domain-containing protein, partial [Chloroflexota bacterium]